MSAPLPSKRGRAGDEANPHIIRKNLHIPDRIDQLHHAGSDEANDERRVARRRKNRELLSNKMINQ
jgi:hypothetical protein